MENKTKSKGKNRTIKIEHWKMVSIYLMVYDALAVTFSYFLALLLRFDFKYSAIPIVYLKPWELFAPIYAFICIIIFSRLRLYRSIWRFASFKELQRITLATIVTTIFHIAGVTAIQRAYLSGTDYAVDRMPLSYYIMGAIFQMILVTGIRFSYRFVLLLRASRTGKAASNIMIVGAGSAGQMILRDIRRTSMMSSRSGMDERVVCFIDDNRNKWYREVDGVPVVGMSNIIRVT